MVQSTANLHSARLALRKWWTAVLCAAGLVVGQFVVGQLVWGQEAALPGGSRGAGLKPAAIHVAAEVALVEGGVRDQGPGARRQESGKAATSGREGQGSAFGVQGSGIVKDTAANHKLVQNPKPGYPRERVIQNLSVAPAAAVAPIAHPQGVASPAVASVPVAPLMQSNPFVAGAATAALLEAKPFIEAKPITEAAPLIEARPIEAKPLTPPFAGTEPGSAAAAIPLLEAKPLKIQPPPAARPIEQPAKPQASDNLPPIIPAWAMPRPAKAATGGRGQGVGGRESGVEGQGSGTQRVPGVQGSEKSKAEARTTKDKSASSPPIPNPKSQIPNAAAAAPLQMELGAPRSGGRESGVGSRESINPKSQTPNPKSPILHVAYEAPSFVNQLPPAPRPLPAANDEVEFGQLPEGSPFEAIQQSGSIKLRVRRSILLRTKVDVYRTAIVDEAVCDIVQFTPREVSIIGRSVGQTHVTFWFDDPAMAPLTYLVEVKPDAEQVKADEDKYELLENVINEMFPDSKVHLVIVADKLLVKGQAKDSEEAAQIMTIVRAQSGIRGGTGPGGIGPYGGISEGAATPVLSLQATGGNPGPAYQIINMLRVPGVQQVALKVKIAELNRSAARGFGVDINAAINFSDSVEGSKLFLSSLLNASNTGGTSLLTSFSGDDVSIGIRYLQERGVIRLLSEPTLVTLSGRPATFIAGGEFAVPTVVGSVGLNAVTTDFRAFGAIISFLPTIVDKDRVRLQVAPEFSQINDQLSVNGTPGLNVRAATTTVEMREGQTLAIAGLLEDTYKATNVGDLPGLAKIFGRRDTARSETELIILVSPELVHPMEPEEVPPLPGFDVTEPTAGQFFLHGDIEGNPTQDYRSTVWPRLRKRYGMGGPAMTSGPFGHGQ